MLPDYNGIGVYILSFGPCGQYVGSSQNCKSRLYSHLIAMRSGKHTKAVQAAYSSFGNPECQILEQLPWGCCAYDIFECEAKHMKAFTKSGAKLLNSPQQMDMAKYRMNDINYILRSKGTSHEWAVKLYEKRTAPIFLPAKKQIEWTRTYKRKSL